jgi:hypothetical protein
MVTRRSTLAPSRCSAILRWREQMAVCAVCWRGLAALMSWSSTTRPWLHCPSLSAATSGRSAKIAIKCAQPSSRRNRRFHAGTSRSAIPHWLTASLDRLVHNAHRIEMRGDNPSGAYPKHKFPQRRLWSTSRVIFDSRRKPEYPYTPRTRFSSRVAVAARGTHVEMARAVFRSTPA